MPPTSTNNCHNPPISIQLNTAYNIYQIINWKNLCQWLDSLLTISGISPISNRSLVQRDSYQNFNVCIAVKLLQLPTKIACFIMSWKCWCFCKMYGVCFTCCYAKLCLLWIAGNFSLLIPVPPFSLYFSDVRFAMWTYPFLSLAGIWFNACYIASHAALCYTHILKKSISQVIT